MKRAGYSILIALVLNALLFSTLVAAATLEVKTLPNSYVTIRILPEGEPYSSLQSYYNVNTGSEGKAIVTYSTDLAKVDIELYLKLSPEQTEAELYERYNGIGTSEKAFLDLPKSEGYVEPVKTETETATEDTEAEIPQSITSETQEAELSKEVESQPSDINFPITGKVTSESTKEGSYKSYIIYGVGAVILIGIVLFGASFVKRGGPARQPADHNKPFRSSDDAVRDAEYRFAEAQTQLDRVKKIKDTEYRMAQDAEELRRLKGE